MEFKEITDLIKLINKTDLSEFKMKKDDIEIVIRTNNYQKGDQVITQAAPSIVSIPAATPAAQAPTSPVTAPAVSAPVADLPVEAEPDTDENLVEVKSPIVGTFYRSPGPDKPVFVKVGDSITAGDTVCIVEAMKLFNEIESEVSGKIVKVLVEDASPVQYDQPLFLVDPKG